MSMMPGRNYFAEYKGRCQTFIETGTYRADGVQLAIDAGFDDIYTIDIVEHEKRVVTIPIERNPNIRYLIGESSEMLAQVLFTLNNPYMLWLDAHSQLTEDEPDNFPLMDELEIILDQPNSRLPDVILIDDYLYMTHPQVTGFKDHEIQMMLQACGYKTKLLPNPIKNNILVAYV